MSENMLILIPTNPEYVPDSNDQQKACDILKLLLPYADRISVKATTEIRFIDAGVNLERIVCPICRKGIDMNWWVQMMDSSYKETKFMNLSAITLCCSTVCSLNALQYSGPVGFARFSLEVLNPSNTISDESILVLESVLKSKLRKISAHY